MYEAWLTAVPALLTAVGIVVIPGAVLMLAGWGASSLRAWLFAPAASIALLAVSATGASLAGVPWSLLPVAVVTLLAAVIAFIVRRWVTRRSGDHTIWTTAGQAGRGWIAPVTAGVGLVVAASAIAAQLMVTFGGPENISQTFDNVVHLNAIRLTLDEGDASIFAVGATSDIDWYPNGWHSVITLVAQVSGASIPLAVNAGTIAICAVAWPASALALAATLFAARPAALTLTAALSTGFGAFPLLLLYFGVLYPNATAYAILPAGIAAVWMLLRSRGREIARSTALLIVVCAGIGLSHPNAFLALYALTVAVAVAEFGRSTLGARSPRARFVPVAGILLLVVIGVGLWRFGRTNEGMSMWSAWQSTAQAFGEAALIAPRGYPITIVTAVLLLVGMIVVIRRPARWFRVGVPFASAAFLFIVVSGIPAGTALRDMFTSPWYNDSYRLAALLPAVGVPVAVLGGLAVIDLVSHVWRRLGWRDAIRIPLVIAAVAALFGVAVGPNVTATIADAQAAYRMDESAPLLTHDEAALIGRLDRTTPEDALVIVNPWTGGSLAYALAGREVTERHIFSARSADEEFLDAHLTDIDTDPQVCEAVSRIGARFVLDFGDRNVFSDPASGQERGGINDLTPSDHLVLIDSEGPDARLFAIEGC